jgi:ethanolamine kinase
MEELPISVDEINYEADILNILKAIRPNWRDNSKLKLKTFTDGITNKLVGCFYSDNDINDVILVRIYGNKTDLLIDRSAEKFNIRLLHKHGLAPELYATFRNGLCYEYVPGSTLNPTNIYEPKIWRLVASHMARMHKLPLTVEQKGEEPMLKTKTLQFLDLIPEKFSDPVKHERISSIFPSVSKMREEFDELYNALVKENSPVLFCHNDLLLGNVIYTEESNKVTFIDYEYGAVNHQAFDIGNHFAEFPGIGASSDIDYSKYPPREFQLEWIRVYLEAFHSDSADAITDESVLALYTQVNKFALGSHFLWTCWSLIQAEHSTIDFDFIAFGASRYNEYLAKKELFLSL